MFWFDEQEDLPFCMKKLKNVRREVCQFSFRNILRKLKYNAATTPFDDETEQYPSLLHAFHLVRPTLTAMIQARG
jgi:hypothetical protein